MSKTPFRSFIRAAVDAYFRNIRRVQAEPDLQAPWKTQGQQWHLSQKSMSARQKPRWEPALLLAVVGRFKSVRSDLALDWGSKTAVHLLERKAGVLGKIVTNMGRGLRIELRAPKNLIVPAHVDGLGEDLEIKRRPEADWIVFWLRSIQHLETRRLADVWRLCSEGSQAPMTRHADVAKGDGGMFGAPTSRAEDSSSRLQSARNDRPLTPTQV